MLSELARTPGWQAILKALSEAVRVPVFVRDLENKTIARFGGVPFFQELLDKSRHESSHEPKDGVNVESGFATIALPVTLDKRAGTLLLSPFRIDEKCGLEEEFEDAFAQLQMYSREAVENAACLASFIAKILPGLGKAELDQARKVAQALLAMEFVQQTAQFRTLERLLQSAAQFFVQKFRLNNCSLAAYGIKHRHFSGNLDAAYSSVESAFEGQLRATRAPCFISNAKTDFLLKSVEGVELLPQTIAAFPLIVETSTIGWAILYSEGSMGDYESISELASLLLRQILHVVQYQAMKKSAVTDNLTGLFNRTFIEETLGKTLAGLSQEKKPVTFLMFDIDNFKEYNDSHGHPEGDSVLRLIAGLTAKIMPPSALCCRYGGEEFLVVLPNTPVEAGRELAEHLREAVQSQSPLTVSIGTISCLNSSASFTTLISEADRALYKAKNSGKNRVVAFLMVDKSLGVIDIEEV